MDKTKQKICTTAYQAISVLLNIDMSQSVVVFWFKMPYHGYSIMVNHGSKIFVCIGLVGKSYSGSESIFENFTRWNK